jgi:hypothetical protein
VRCPRSWPPIAAPNPVPGADDKTHLVYEIVLMNMGSTTAMIQTLDAMSGTVLGTLEGGHPRRCSG